MIRPRSLRGFLNYNIAHRPDIRKGLKAYSRKKKATDIPGQSARRRRGNRGYEVKKRLGFPGPRLLDSGDLTCQYYLLYYKHRAA